MRVVKKYRPTTGHGAILITTNSRHLARPPIYPGIEVKGFSDIDGAKFLLKCLSREDIRESEPEFVAAFNLSKKLGGHALGIHQMAALIYARSETIVRFLPVYESAKRKLHRDCGVEWDPHNYKDSLDTIWQLSFECLRPDDRTCLGILSFLTQDFIPVTVLRIERGSAVTQNLSFCCDDYMYVFCLIVSCRVLDKILGLTLHKPGRSPEALT